MCLQTSEQTLVKIRLSSAKSWLAMHRSITSLWPNFRAWYPLDATARSLMPQTELEKRQSLSHGEKERKAEGRDAAETASAHMGGQDR